MSNVETKAARAEAAKAKVEAATADAALKAKVCLAPVVCPAAKAPLAPTPVVLEQSLQSEGVVLVLNEWPSSTTLSLQRAPMTKGLPAPPPTGVGEGGGKEGRKEAEGQSKN